MKSQLYMHQKRQIVHLRNVIFSWLFVITMCFYAADFASAATYDLQIQADFTFDTQAAPGKVVSGYRLFKENALLCQTTLAEQKSITCNDSGEEGTYSFTLSALYSDGTEGPHSEPFPFTISTGGTSPPPTTTGNTAFTFSWETTSATNIASYRFYLNDQKLCESTTPSATSITCNAGLLNEVMSFSMASVDNLGIESARSNVLKIDPAEYSELFTWKTTTFFWEYDSTATASSGFKIYHNNTYLCGTVDPTARQLTCDILLADTNVFEITAMDGATETTVSNSIVYVKDVTAPGTDTLAAVITTSGQSGVAPLSLIFDGTTSTGPISSYSWSFGDGKTASGASVTHTYESAGIYTATLTVADASGTSRQSSTTITVSEPTEPPPVTNTPPTAVISTSAAVGEAPLTVQFDGSGSTSAQPPIASYSWSFGDGSSGEGAVVPHTYTAAGTYSASLTVTDSVGLISQPTSTPILISAAPVQENKQPIASFTATPSSGSTPLSVSFNASGSSDPDGSISSYVWSFGEGSSASGVSAQHTFTEIADYAVSLQVTDDKGKTAVATQTISVLAKDEAKLDIELSEALVDHNWKTLTFSKPFVNPIVVAGPPSVTDAAPATIQIRNVTTTGFEVRIHEWDYLDGTHAPETFSFMVMEKGIYTLANGVKLEAGTFTGSTSFEKISLQQSYSLVPVILTQVLTENEADTVSGRIRNSAVGSFEYKMQEQEKNLVSHKPETVGYIAWEPGKGDYSGISWETGFITPGVTHDWFDLTFQTQFPDLPFFMAGMQTSAEGDTASIRSQSVVETKAKIKVEEEQSKDKETKHAAEVVGYLAISGVIQETPSATDKEFTFTWDYADTESISGFRFYLNDTLLCETKNPTDRQYSCNSAMLNETMVFSMKAVFLDGSESAPSSVLSISPDEYPELFGIRLAAFTWEIDTLQEENISGFRIYNNTAQICETGNPAERELTCNVQIGTSANAFTIVALEVGGNETFASNILTYTP